MKANVAKLVDFTQKLEKTAGFVAACCGRKAMKTRAEAGRQTAKSAMSLLTTKARSHEGF